MSYVQPDIHIRFEPSSRDGVITPISGKFIRATFPEPNCYSGEDISNSSWEEITSSKHLGWCAYAKLPPTVVQDTFICFNILVRYLVHVDEMARDAMSCEGALRLVVTRSPSHVGNSIE